MMYNARRPIHTILQNDSDCIDINNFYSISSLFYILQSNPAYISCSFFALVFSRNSSL